jgi:hypothetical protein
VGANRAIELDLPSQPRTAASRRTDLYGVCLAGAGWPLDEDKGHEGVTDAALCRLRGAQVTGRHLRAGQGREDGEVGE